MQARTLPSRGPSRVVDLVICLLILCLGALPFFLYEKAPDLLHEDANYVTLAKSLLHGSYSNDFVSEKIQPPGLPVILAAVCATSGCTHDTLIRTMPVFLTIGFLVSYAVIRRQRGRLIAAASCLLLASSPVLFAFVSSRLWPSYPYFLVSMLVLLLAPRLEASVRGTRRVLAASLLALLVTAAVLIQSAGIALIGGLMGWALLSLLRDFQGGKSRLAFVAPAILLSVLAQALWLQRGSNPREWPLQGYPDGYTAQLRLKSGNYPEMGLAAPKDVVLRVGKNLKERTLHLEYALTRSWISPSAASIGVAGALLLTLLGLCSSLLRSDYQLCALYFIGYECIYLLWPWSYETPRFALPILPLACLYLAEGAIALRRWSLQHPRRVAAAFPPLSIALAFFAARRGWTAAPGHGLQDKLSAVFWVLSAAMCGRLAWKGSLQSPEFLSSARSFFSRHYSTGSFSFSHAQLLGVLLVTCLVVNSVVGEIPIGRENLTAGSSRLDQVPEIQAARWIQSHTDPSAIVASRLVSLLYYYSGRKIVWFPPITNPDVLMRGIGEHHIQYVIVIDRGFNYYLPADPVCFDVLYRAYPQSFRLANANGSVKIYEVLQAMPRSPAELSVSSPLKSLPTRPLLASGSSANRRQTDQKLGSY
jgi:hypothetical protein